MFNHTTESKERKRNLLSLKNSVIGIAEPNENLSNNRKDENKGHDSLPNRLEHALTLLGLCNKIKRKERYSYPVKVDNAGIKPNKIIPFKNATNKKRAENIDNKFHSFQLFLDLKMFLKIEPK